MKFLRTIINLKLFYPTLVLFLIINLIKLKNPIFKNKLLKKINIFLYIS